MQSRITAQFGEQLPTTAHYLPRIVVAKVSVQHQIGVREQPLEEGQLFLDQLLEAQQPWGQLYLGLVPVLAACGTPRLAFDLGLTLLLLGLGCG